MKRLYFISKAIIITVLVIIAISGNENVITEGKEQQDNIEIVFGVVIVNGQPKCIDPNYFEVPDVVMSENFKQKMNSEIIKAGRLSFLTEPKLLVYDIKKDQPGFLLRNTKRELKYKVENQTLYVSDDGIEWEAVKFKVVNDQPHKDKDEPFVTIYWVVYLECRWFKGEYEIFSIPNA
ncbi:MAG TPA: hypothetical protein DD789_11330 [Firmicutes bacterium]|nr:hypothetical protein [Bacillota bacterium]